jgi:hypothetical protein
LKERTLDWNWRQLIEFMESIWMGLEAVGIGYGGPSLRQDKYQAAESRGFSGFLFLYRFLYHLKCLEQRAASALQLMLQA